MNKPNKCKNCQWYGKPYWSIINPCDSCPNENNYKTIITIDREPLFKEVLTEEEIKKAMTDKSIFELTIKEKDKEIEKLNNIIEELDYLISLKIIREANENDYHIDVNDMVEIKTKLYELKEKSDI